MGQEDLEIFGIDVGVLGRASEEVVGVLNHVLIEGCAGGDHNGGGGGLPASGASGALPGGGDGARISGHDHGVEGADVDAELKGVGGHYGADFAIAKLALDFAALAGKVAA